jgi:hypothetical protein
MSMSYTTLYGTSTSTPEPAQVGPPAPFVSPEAKPTTVLTAGGGPESPSSGTGSVPPAIRGNWGLIAKARLTERMYSSLMRVATANSPYSALTPKSLRDFFTFWAIIRNVAAAPEFGLSPDGTLTAEWYRSQRQRLDVRFLDRKLIFGLIVNNNILEGAEVASTVAALLKNHPSKPLLWTAE